MIVVEWTENTAGPVALIGVPDSVDHFSVGSRQFEDLGTVAKSADPAADDIRDRGILGREHRGIGGHHQVLTRPDRHGREGEIDTVGQPPSVECHRAETPVRISMYSSRMSSASGCAAL